MLGDNIRTIRKSKRISINKLSKISGISLGYLSDLENNKFTNPTLDKLNKIAESLRVDIKDFFTDKEKLDITFNVINESHEIIGNYFNNGNLDDSIYDIMIQFDNEKFSKKEQNQIIDYINYIISKRENKE